MNSRDDLVREVVVPAVGCADHVEGLGDALEQLSSQAPCGSRIETALAERREHLGRDVESGPVVEYENRRDRPHTSP